MLRLQPVTSILRFFHTASEAHQPTPDAVCTLVWEPPHAVWIHGLLGTLSRALMRELCTFMQEHEVHTIKALRADGHRLPLAREHADGYLVIDVQEFAKRKRIQST